MAKKILIGMVEIAGQYRNLSLGLTSLGVKHDFITYASNEFAYGGETKTPIVLEWSKRLRWYRQRSQSRIVRLLASLVIAVLQSLWGLFAIFYYDIYIFGYGTSLLPGNIDLPILKILRKRVVSNIGHGSEARAPYLNGKWTKRGVHDDAFLRATILLSRRIARKVRRIQRFSTVTVGSPYSSSTFAELPMINRLALGRPVSLPTDVRQRVSQSDGSVDGNPIRILHCPSDRNAKGTKEIAEAVSRLREKGYRIDFELLERASNAEVLRRIAECDLIVDQLYSDLPMPTISTEAAMYGKPSIVGGYDLDALRASVPPNMWPPVHITEPELIDLAIEDLIVHRERRERLGRELRDFVESEWTVESYARRYMRVVEGNIPAEWWFDPRKVDYFCGCGQSRGDTAKVVSELIRFGGISSLQLPRVEILERNEWLGISMSSTGVDRSSHASRVI